MNNCMQPLMGKHPRIWVNTLVLVEVKRPMKTPCWLQESALVTRVMPKWGQMRVQQNRVETNRSRGERHRKKLPWVEIASRREFFFSLNWGKSKVSCFMFSAENKVGGQEQYGGGGNSGVSVRLLLDAIHPQTGYSSSTYPMIMATPIEFNSKFTARYYSNNKHR